MRFYLIVLLVVINSCGVTAQIQNKLEGKWVPKKNIQNSRTVFNTRIGEIQLPIEEINISEKVTRNFFEVYENNVPEGIENIIVIKTFKSEPNSISTKRTLDDGVEKFSLTEFWRYLNLKYVSREVANDYKNCEVFMSKRGDELLVEVIDQDGRKAGQQVFVISK